MQTALVASITEPHCEMAWESACEFHGLQYVQLFADQKFPQASAFDATLRWNQHRFSFGSGRIVARGVAKHLGLDWKIPLAPRSDGFKVTTASRHCITRFAELYQILIAALEIELHATYMATRSIAWKSYNLRSLGDHREVEPNPPLEVSHWPVSDLLHPGMAVRGLPLA